jgi:hypothetical protein
MPTRGIYSDVTLPYLTSSLDLLVEVTKKQKISAGADDTASMINEKQLNNYNVDHLK